MRSFDSVSSKRISFILATKNRAKFLEKALTSHRKLIGLDDELIIIDGNSKDNTAAVIKKNSDIVDIFISEPDVSEGDATNKGVLFSRGKYIKLLTDDDIFYKNSIQNAVKIMENNPQIDILLSGGTKQHGEEIGYVYVPRGVNYGKSIDNIFKYGACGLGLLIKRGIFSKIGLFNPSAVSLDADFLAKAIYLGANVKFCRQNMYLHKIEEHSAVASYNERLVQDFERIKKLYGIRDDLLLDFRVKISQVLFPHLPQFFKDFLSRIFKKGKNEAKMTPIWDKGLD